MTKHVSMFLGGCYHVNILIYYGFNGIPFGEAESVSEGLMKRPAP